MKLSYQLLRKHRGKNGITLEQLLEEIEEKIEYLDQFTTENDETIEIIID